METSLDQQYENSY